MNCVVWSKRCGTLLVGVALAPLRHRCVRILATVATTLMLASFAGATGTATVTVGPANWNFGNVAIGSGSTTTLQVTNSSTSTASVTICSITPESRYLLPSPPSLPSQTLAPSQSFTFQVEFFPSQTGMFYGGVAVGYVVAPAPCKLPAPNYSYEVMVGTGVANASLAVTTFPILPDVPPGFAPAQNYSQTLAATAGVPPYTWSLASGSTLPGGLALSSSGVLTGGLTTVQEGNYSFTVQVADSQGAKAESTLTLEVIPQAAGSVAQCNSTPWDVAPGVPPTGTPITPVPDLGAGTYCPNGANCVEGGLYPNGSNVRPSTNNYAQNGVNIAGSMAPITDPAAPLYSTAVVLISMGFSNPFSEFQVFSALDETDLTKNPYLQFVDGAKGDETPGCLSGRDWDPLCDPNYWTVYIPGQLSAAGVTANQVEALWIKETDPDNHLAFPNAQYNLRCDLETIFTGLVVGCVNPTPNPGLLTHFPNLKMVFVSSRTFGGYTTTGSKETYAYETAYAVQGVMSDFISGPLEGTSPWLSWGPYLWTNGLTPRSDGLVWTCQDVVPEDGRHPSDPRGRLKVAVELLNFFKSDVAAEGWFNLGSNVQLSSYSLSFAQQALGTSSGAQAITLTNTGSAPLTISTVSLGPDFTQTNTCGASVAVGGSCTFNITFKPVTAGTLDESLQIADNAANSPQTVALSGTGTAAKLSTLSLNFGTVHLGQTSSPQTVTLTNVSQSWFGIKSISAFGGEPAEFPLTNNCPQTLGPGASCSVTVAFAPRVTGLQSSTLQFSDSAGASPQNVSLTGTGSQ